YISDKNFLNGLLFQARVSEIKICPSDSTRNTITLTNAVKIASRVDTTLLDRMKELAMSNLPYSMTISTDNGVSFKEENGQSTITPKLYKGSEAYTNVDWKYFQNETFLGQGSTYTVKAINIGTEPLTIDVRGYVDGVLKVHQQITFTNIYDGVSPIKLEIITSNGNIFKNNNIYTNLTAKVYRGDEEIDKGGTAFNYIWTKVNADETPDESWNRNHSYSQKTIRITNADLFRRATFSCAIEYADKQV
ncbi:MAG: phage tail protein, partial [Clostridiales bacterium]|nr:phage tail protein [Clostridiales bacterium]